MSAASALPSTQARTISASARPAQAEVLQPTGTVEQAKVQDSVASVPQFRAWLDGQRKTSTMLAALKPLADIGKPWRVSQESVARSDGAFFAVKGLDVRSTTREVAGWDQPIIDESGTGSLVALVQDAATKDVLVTAKQEPGNDAPGCVLLAPSYQASLSNLSQAHGGKKPPLATALEQGVRRESCALPGDGGRFYHKKVEAAVISVPDKRSIAEQVGSNQTWTTLGVLLDPTVLPECNPHLRDLLVLLVVSSQLR